MKKWKRLALFLPLFVACSAAVNACGHGPKVTICVIDGSHLQMHCNDYEGHQEVKSVADADNYICVSADDGKKLVDYAKTKCFK